MGRAGPPHTAPGWWSRLLAYGRSWLPTPESIRRNRLLAPFADRLTDPILWKADSIGVPRGAALGTFLAGLLPVGHSVVATLLAPWVRANILAAIAATWLINPITMPIYYLGSYRLGDWIMRTLGVRGAPAATALDLPAHGAGMRAWWDWAEVRIEPLAIGVCLLSVFAATVIYAICAVVARLSARRAAKVGGLDCWRADGQTRPPVQDG